jgi:hypothetical protein
LKHKGLPPFAYPQQKESTATRELRDLITVQKS